MEGLDTESGAESRPLVGAWEGGAGTAHGRPRTRVPSPVADASPPGAVLGGPGSVPGLCVLQAVSVRKEVVSVLESRACRSSRVGQGSLTSCPSSSLGRSPPKRGSHSM